MPPGGILYPTARWEKIGCPNRSPRIERLIDAVAVPSAGKFALPPQTVSKFNILTRIREPDRRWNLLTELQFFRK
jgi:hypothetical protein